MRLGEATVTSRSTFDPNKHVTHAGCVWGVDLNGRYYVKLRLPSAKTARPREIQEIFLVAEGELCPMELLKNLAHVVPATANMPLFS